MSTAMERKREVWVDWMRVSACFLVMLVHSTEPFYLGGDGSLILSASDAFWVSLFDCIARACVPLFVVASSYLQFPVHYATGEFLRRRALRILIPFAIWSVVYALAWGEPVQNFRDLLLNFNYAAGHLWFVYMIIGLYLLMPMLSPWAEKVGEKELRGYLLLCLFTSFIPFIREWGMEGDSAFAYGPGGIPMPAHYPLWGEASWNDFGLFYYFSGFIGYMLLGLYIRKFLGNTSRRDALGMGIPCWIAGFAICFWGFLSRVSATAGGVYPVAGDVSLAVGWETPWLFNTVGVVLMTIGWVMIFKGIGSSSAFYEKVVQPVSKASYGMYLCHMLVLAAFSGLFRSAFGLGEDGVLGAFTTPVQILLTAVCSYVCLAFVCVQVRRIPKVGKWIIG